MKRKEVISLRNPPLLETAFSVIVDLPHITMDSIGNFVANAAPAFTKTKEFGQQTFKFGPDSISSQSISPIPIGCQYVKDGNLVILIQNRAEKEVEFVFSVLPPYTKWSDLYNAAKPILDAFVAEFNVKKVNRIAVRSIDRLYAPYEGCPVSDIITTIPPDIASLPTPLVYGFSYQDTMYYKDYDLCAQVIRATSRGMKDRRFSVILDMDVSTPLNGRYVPGDIDLKIPKIVELKDTIFFSSVGEKCMEGFQ